MVPKIFSNFKTAKTDTISQISQISEKIMGVLRY